MALADVDYTAVDGMQIILNGNMMTVDVAVDLINDSDFEPDEIFRGLLILTSGERVSVGADSANATIIDDESECHHTPTHTRITHFHTHSTIHTFIMHTLINIIATHYLHTTCVHIHTCRYSGMYTTHTQTSSHTHMYISTIE